MDSENTDLDFQDLIDNASRTSMVSIRLSEVGLALPTELVEDVNFEERTQSSKASHRRSSIDILRGLKYVADHGEKEEDIEGGQEKIVFSRRQSRGIESELEEATVAGEDESKEMRQRSDSTSSDSTTESNEVDWTELTKTEESEVKDEGSDEVRYVQIQLQLVVADMSSLRPFC